MAESAQHDDNEQRDAQPEPNAEPELEAEVEAEAHASAAAAAEANAEAQREALEEDGDGFSDEDLEEFLAEAASDAEGIESAADEGDTEGASAEADELVADLKRVQAEYANYRRRTEAEREVARTVVTADVLRGFLPVLDDIDRAEKHGDLGEGTPLAVIAAKLRGLVEKAGLEKFGEPGQAFDPVEHEAIAQVPNPDVEGEVVADVVESGYRIGDRLVRVAKVAVFVAAE